MGATSRRGPAPSRSLQQRFDALRRANVVRTYRKDLKAELRAGRSVADVLDDVPDEVETMRVYDLLMAVPKFGRVKVNRILASCRISPSRTVGGLSERQRRELTDHLT